MTSVTTMGASIGVGMYDLALAGGVGGAKLALGLSRVLPADELLVIANTGDDFEHLGLSISPDIDTLTYTLAGLANPELGWGRKDETWSFMETLATVGGETWFRLGDRDLSVHLQRTLRLRQGASLSEVTGELYRALGIPELGALLSCNRDAALIEGYHPGVQLTRSTTLMQGGSCCDFRYELIQGSPSTNVPGVKS